MNHHYRDITDKLGRPLWWDEYAVPRYCEFSPHETANIYAREVAFVEIMCQGCGARFNVAMTQSPYAMVTDPDTKERTLAPPMSERIDDLHYGDPPNYGCCAAGPTMNSVPVRVVEFWALATAMEWERRPELERAITCDWFTGDTGEDS